MHWGIAERGPRNHESLFMAREDEGSLAPTLVIRDVLRRLNRAELEAAGASRHWRFCLKKWSLIVVGLTFPGDPRHSDAIEVIPVELQLQTFGGDTCKYR